MKSYVTAGQQVHPNVSHGPDLPCLTREQRSNRLSSQSVYLARWIYVTITVIKSSTIPRHCDLIDFLKSVESDYGGSFLSLVTSGSTWSQRTVNCPDASAFHYLSEVASWMSTVTPGKSTRTRRIQLALATYSNLSNIPLMISSSPSGRTQISTVFKEWKGVKGRRASSISRYTTISYTHDTYNIIYICFRIWNMFIICSELWYHSSNI